MAISPIVAPDELGMYDNLLLAGRDFHRSTTKVSDNAQRASVKGFVAACVRIIAGEVSNAFRQRKVKVYKNAGLSSKVLMPKDHWLVRLLESPNEIHNPMEFYQLMTMYTLLEGNCFIYTPTFGSPYPMRAYLIPPGRVTTRTPDGELFYEISSARGEKRRVLPREMLHIKDIYPQDSQNLVLTGTSRLRSLDDFLYVSEELTKYLGRFFENDTRPPIVLKSDDPDMDTEQFRLFQALWQGKIPNYPIRALLQGGLEVINLAESSLEIDYTSLAEWIQKGVTALFGIPLGRLTGDYTNKATAEVQQQVFYNSTIQPLLNALAVTMAWHYGGFEDDIEIEVDPFGSATAEEIRAQEAHDITHGIKTINEVRRSRGLPPAIGGDAIYRPNTVAPVDPMLESFQSIVQMSADAPIEKSTQIEKIRTVIKAVNKSSYYDRKQKLVENMAQSLKGFLKPMMDQVVDAVVESVSVSQPSSGAEKWFDKLMKREGKINVMSEDDAIALMSKIFGKEKGALKNLLESDLYGQAFIDQLGDFAESEGKIKPDPKAVSTSSTRALGLIEDAVDGRTSWPRSLVESVRGAVESVGYTNIDNLKQALRDQGAKQAESRVTMIATTTSNAIQGEAQLDVFGQLGVEYEWLTQLTGDPRDTHVSANGKKPDEEGYFTIGSDKMKSPCTGSVPEENVNCRCVLLPVSPEN